MFETGPAEERNLAGETRKGDARVRRPVRDQLQWVTVELESPLPQNHRAQAIWGLLEKLDVSSLSPAKAIKERQPEPAPRPAPINSRPLKAIASSIVI